MCQRWRADEVVEELIGNLMSLFPGVGDNPCTRFLVMDTWAARRSLTKAVRCVAISVTEMPSIRLKCIGNRATTLRSLARALPKDKASKSW
jgi:hypothetical protein